VGHGDGRICLRVLGPVVASQAGQEIALGGRKQRAVIAALACSVGRVVSSAQLVDAVWDEDATDQSEHTLQVYISNLRKALEPDRDRRTPASVLVTQAPGYVLTAEKIDLDLTRFRQLRQRGRSLLDSADVDAAADFFDDAMATWNGPAFADVRGTAWFDAQATRLEEERLATEEDLCDARLAAGSHRELVGRLEDLVAAHPFRERLRGQLMIALYRSGRQADALAVYRATREALVEELGIEPGDELRALEQAILLQDPALSSPAFSTGSSANDSDVLATVDTRGLHRTNAFLVLPDGQQIALPAGHLLIGRTPDATLRLTDQRVSRRHALIRSHDGGFLLTDLGSTNGTTVNGELLAGERALTSGDVISLGGFELRVEL
jgi:DNA-binding SARP family transcriptional activator